MQGISIIYIFTVMANSLNDVWIHAVWSTKYRESLIDNGIEQLLFDYIKNQFAEQKCSVIAINGTPDHIHCLFQLNSDRSIGQVLKQVKGSSSRYINENNLTLDPFSWQRGYSAHSVSKSIKHS